MAKRCGGEGFQSGDLQVYGEVEDLFVKGEGIGRTGCVGGRRGRGPGWRCGDRVGGCVQILHECDHGVEGEGGKI